jgi:hypothetical protein
VTWRTLVALLPSAWTRRTATSINVIPSIRSPPLITNLSSWFPQHRILGSSVQTVQIFSSIGVPQAATMADEYDEVQTGDDGGMTGPGAPTPLSALEVRHPLLVGNCN